MYINTLNKNLLSKEDLISLNLKNIYSEKLKNLNQEEIIRKTIYLNLSQANFMFDLIIKTYRNIFKGNVLDLGSGSGFFSALLSKKKQVNKVDSLEIVEGYVKNIHPIIFSKYGNRQKIQSYLGSFNNLSKLIDCHYDLIFEYDSFHHSSDLQKTFSETFKKLKKNAILLCVDRIQPNRMTNSTINNKLNLKYSKSFFEKCDLPYRDLSRKENGEHEYKEKEWKSFAKNAGFQNISVTRFKRNNIKNTIKSLLSHLPNLFTQQLSFMKYYNNESFFSVLSSYFNQNLSPSSKGKNIGVIKKNDFPKSINVLFAQKLI